MFPRYIVGVFGLKLLEESDLNNISYDFCS